jgi:subtilisin family serine protease
MGRQLRLCAAARGAVALLSASVILGYAPVVAAPAGNVTGANVQQAVRDQVANGDATFWVLLKEQADLSPAQSDRDWAARGRHVYDRLTATADSSQTALRELLRSRGAIFEPFWIINAVRVTGGADLLDTIAARPEVAEVRADVTYQIPKPLPGQQEATIQAFEWNIARVRAQEVWNTFNDRGEDIVVANIDTGVQFDHPALVMQYRGRNPDGTFDHNYNWFDPSKVCGNPSLAPCDNINHGTHTMGTMVGDDGDPGTNQIGVAPHAKWIAAKGCETFGCSLNALLKSGEWVLAPTDLEGMNPDPALRPHVVNNSWGGPGSDPFYRSTVQAWVAAGLFPAFANGNGPPGCGFVAAPGSYPESYGVGAFDINNAIAGFSLRGPSPFGQIIKPNIAAPGVNVKSSVPGGRYDNFSGTSMATPHLAGVVALLWSGTPPLKGDIAKTRAFLDDTGISTSDLACGGTPDNNNVWGRGRLDAFAAVDFARSDLGTLQGTVTAATGGAPINGATVQIEGPIARTRTTASDGTYSAALKVGTYTLTASATGFLKQIATVEIQKDQTTVNDFALQTSPSVQGHVTDANDGRPVVASVRLLQNGSPVAVTTTDAAGFYKIFQEAGDYVVEASSRNYDTGTAGVTLVDATPVTQDFALPTGIASISPTRLEFVVLAGQQRSRTLTLGNAGTGDLGFEIFESGGDRVTTTSSVGLTRNPNYDPNSTTTQGLYLEGTPPGWSITAPGDVIRSFPTTGLTLGWGVGQAGDPLWVSDVAPPGAKQNHEFTVQGEKTGRQWNTPWADAWGADMAYDAGRGLMCQLSVGAAGAGSGIYCWDPNTGEVKDSITATLPWNQISQRGLAYRPDDDSFYVGGWNEGILYHVKGLSSADKGAVISQCRPPDRSISGLAWNPAEGVVWEATNSPTDTIYQLDPERCQVLSTLKHPQTGGFKGAGLEMDETTGNLWVVSQGDVRAGTPSTVSLVASGVPAFNKIPWLSETPTKGNVAPGGQQPIELTVDTTGLQPGLYSGSLYFLVTAGRQSKIRVPINLIVPAYMQGANAGGPAYTDSLGDPWAPDQAFAPGQWGYLDEGKLVAAPDAPIGGTADPTLYRTARESPIAYRFENLPAGTYQVELRFAELDETVGINGRLFDVIINDQLVLPAHDIVLAAGSLTADDYSFFVRVAGGRLDVRFVTRTGFGEPIINALRVTHRPDR